MAKKRKPKKRVSREKASTSSYTDAEGNTLVLRDSLSPGSIAKVSEQIENQAYSVDDIWQRRTELIFERLAVSWEIAGLPLDDQKMLLGRYRMADSETRRWVRETLDRHVRQHIPDLA
jgi:pyruvate-formate lyase